MASRSNGQSLMSKLAFSSLAGAFILHVAAATLGYVGSFVLIRHRLHDAQVVPKNPSPRAVVVASGAGSADPHISEPIVMASSQTPSALESGDVRVSKNIEHGTAPNAHLSPVPAIRAFSTPPTITETLIALLHHPARLDIDMRRESLFNLSGLLPRVGASAAAVDSSDHDADARKIAAALALLLNRCHGACSCFVLFGFVLVVIGLVASLWELFERCIAIFGSVCIAMCLILSFGALG